MNQTLLYGWTLDDYMAAAREAEVLPVADLTGLNILRRQWLTRWPVQSPSVRRVAVETKPRTATQEAAIEDWVASAWYSALLDCAVNGLR